MGSVVSENRFRGLFFQDAFEKEAKSQGFYVRQNHLTARYLKAGRLQVVSALLDYMLVKDGITGFFDCKSYARGHFVYSEVPKWQLDQSVLWNELGVPSGFLCWFKELNAVVFYKGAFLRQAGPGSTFEPQHGLGLGQIESFNLGQLLTQKPVCTTPQT